MTIKSIVPANPDWFALFQDGEEIMKAPVAVWAVINDENAVS